MDLLVLRNTERSDAAFCAPKERSRFWDGKSNKKTNAENKIKKWNKSRLWIGVMVIYNVETSHNNQGHRLFGVKREHAKLKNEACYFLVGKRSSYWPAPLVFERASD